MKPFEDPNGFQYGSDGSRSLVTQAGQRLASRRLHNYVNTIERARDGQIWVSLARTGAPHPAKLTKASLVQRVAMDPPSCLLEFEVIRMFDIGDKTGLLRLPAKTLPRSLARGGAIAADPHGKRPEMGRSLVRSERSGRNA